MLDVDIVHGLIGWGGPAGVLLALAKLISASCHGAAELILARRGMTSRTDPEAPSLPDDAPATDSS
ncbi:MAG: hypothetical protein QOD42_2777 [Sphingomonadales bacterium]|jgi:hypothetical protein|nr:hypothetical protein [Sphingomonadales bacterium]